MESTSPTGSRVTRFEACLVCRRRKLRCDAVQPECKRCRATGSTCQYQDPIYKSRIIVLQNRVKEIEARIQNIEQRRGRSSAPSTVSNSSNNIESVLYSNTLSQRAAAASHVSSPGSPYQAPDPTPSTPVGSSSESNVLSRREPSSLSLPGDVSMKLLNMFMQRKRVSGFELHIGRIMRSFQPDANEPAAPALFNAMLLIGCHFISEPELNFWENLCYERTKLEIEANIARAHLNDRSKYNPLHHLQAMTMLGQWFYLKGRLLEGHIYTTRATRLAIALGLHELDSRLYGDYAATKRDPLHRGIERWKPQDPIELGEAINLWWSCFTRDLAGTVVNGLPPSISLRDVKTVWPVELCKFEDDSGSDLSNDNYSVASLFDPTLVHIVTDVSQDSVSSISAKSAILAYYAGELNTERVSGPEITDEWRARFEECDRWTKYYTRSVTKVYDDYDTEAAAHIALGHAMVDCATIQLHESLADYELDFGAQGDNRGGLSRDSPGGYSYIRCMEACRSVASVTAAIEDIDTSYMHMFFGVSWACAARVFAKQIPRLRRASDTEQAQEMEEQFVLLVRNMERILVTYPILALQVEHLWALREDLARNAKSITG